MVESIYNDAFWFSDGLLVRLPTGASRYNYPEGTHGDATQNAKRYTMLNQLIASSETP
jgi:hypothetical protein